MRDCNHGKLCAFSVKWLLLHIFFVKGKSRFMISFYAGTVLPVILSFLLGAAHFWRAGFYGLSCALLAWGLLLSVARAAWVRMLTGVFLLLLAARWTWVCGELVQLRLIMGEPWIRLACILLGVVAWTLFSAYLVQRPVMKEKYAKHTTTAKYSAWAFALVALLFFCLDRFAPHMLLMHRIAPGFGFMQGFLLSCWAAYVVRLLSHAQTKRQTRMRIWRIFSLVFFGQLALGLVGYSIFLLSGELHLPIPGIILAAPLFRGEGYFMLGLFAVSVFLVGSAWCSYLCYFGVWDATCAEHRRTKPVPKIPPKLATFLPWSAPLFFVLTVAAALFLRLWHVPMQAVLALGLLLGLLLFPALVFLTNKYGFSGYCVAVCPLGVLATRLRFLHPWRIRFTAECTYCQQCVKSCTYRALDAQALQNKKPYATCTLCGNCLAVCKHQGCYLDFAWCPCIGGTREWAHAVFSVLITVMHSVFLGVAMI